MSLLFKLVVCFFGINLLVAGPCIAFSKDSRYERIQSCSQASQDRFAYVLLYELLNKQDSGYYLEIGSGDPIYSNNTYIFENNFGWQGVSLDILDGSQLWYSRRQNPLLVQDATKADYPSILKPFPKSIDYLSLDIDCSYDAVLQRIPFHEYIFKVITIEHDFYRLGDQYRESERKILTSLGYYLLCPDVSLFFNGKDSVFEDWWVHPSAFPADMLNKLKSLDLKAKDHNQIINIIRESFSRSHE